MYDPWARLGELAESLLKTLEAGALGSDWYDLVRDEIDAGEMHTAVELAADGFGATGTSPTKEQHRIIAEARAFIAERAHAAGHPSKLAREGLERLDLMISNMPPVTT